VTLRTRNEATTLVDSTEEPTQGINPSGHQLGSWTAEQGTAFETAEWVLGALIAWCSAETARENRRDRPDVDRLAALDRERQKYAHLRRTLDVHDTSQVQRALTDYGRWRGSATTAPGRAPAETGPARTG
jgi:hypothetical protein